MKNTFAKSFILLLMAGCIGLSGCTKTSGCEFVEEGHFLIGTFHYFERPVKIQKYPGSNKTLLDVNAFLIRDDFSGDDTDTVLITKSSIPLRYRGEDEKHVAVSLEQVLTGGGTITYGRCFCNLLCIEEIE